MSGTKDKARPLAASGLRVLILTADYPPQAWSGIAAAASNQVLGLLEAGAKVRVLTRFRPAQGAPTVHSRLEMHSLEERKFPFRDEAFDWIHLHSLALSELAFELRRRGAVPIAYTAHSVICRELGDSGVGRFWSDIQLRVMRDCDAVILISESERNYLASIAPDIARRAHVIANAVPAPVPRLTPYNPRGPVVFAGRFTTNKGVDTLRRFLPSLLNRWNGRAVLAGGHGDEAGNRAVCELRALAGDKVSAPGWLDRADMDHLLSQASLVLAPSRYEPFGMIAVEAMRAGAPVLAAKVGGLAEILTPESGGRLVASHKPEDWLEEALNILRDDCLAVSLAQRGPQYVKTRFHPLDLAGRLMRGVYAN
jgi:glycogen synthase